MIMLEELPVFGGEAVEELPPADGGLGRECATGGWGDRAGEGAFKPRRETGKDGSRDGGGGVVGGHPG